MSSLPPPGWYADPERPSALRFWDGREWTLHRAPAPAPAPGTAPGPGPVPPRRGSWSLGRVLVTLACLLVTLTAGTAAIGLAAGPATVSTEEPSTRVAGSARSTPGSSPSAAATPRATAVPARPVPRPATPLKKAPAGTASTPVKAAAGLVAVTGVVDGDTIKVRLNGTTERVRVIGIDTPELSSRECYAQEAASRMQSLVQSKQVRLAADPTQANRDRYGRLLRHVRLLDGHSVAQLLIAGGFGREYTYDKAYAGQAAYLTAQSAARSAHRGIWSSGCATPVAPVPVAPAPSKPAAGPAACLIKGNISSEGEKIYHVPGGAFYDQTQISLSKGERWFCSESEALSAGWRASLR